MEQNISHIITRITIVITFMARKVDEDPRTLADCSRFLHGIGLAAEEKYDAIMEFCRRCGIVPRPSKRVQLVPLNLGDRAWEVDYQRPSEDNKLAALLHIFKLALGK